MDGPQVLECHGLRRSFGKLVAFGCWLTAHASMGYAIAGTCTILGASSSVCRRRPTVASAAALCWMAIASKCWFAVPAARRFATSCRRGV